MLRHDGHSVDETIAIEKFSQLSSDVSERETPIIDTETKRESWSHRIQFLFSCVGFSVGFGNLWRFPYVSVVNGGGAFLLPYMLTLFICGMPLCFMEFTLGQMTGLSPVKAFNFAPVFKGVGWAMFVVSGMLCIYANIIMAWTIYYLAMCHTWVPLWSHCNNSWNTAQCYQLGQDMTSINLTQAGNISTRLRSSTEEYWTFEILQDTGDINIIGGINWKILLCMIGAWAITFLCLIKGIKSSGKVVYVTATIPYVFLTIILIRAAMLPGAAKGLLYFLKPQPERFLDSQLWSSAAVQIFFSLGPAWGGLLTMSSYNKYDSNYMSLGCCINAFETRDDKTWRLRRSYFQPSHLQISTLSA